MAKIVLTGWREGLGKVSLSKLQMELLGLSLKQSKCNVDSLLNDEEVIIVVDDTELARKFSDAAMQIGAICRVEENDLFSLFCLSL